MHSTVVVLASTSLQYFTLDHLEHFRLDNGFVVTLYIILWDFSFIDLGFLSKEVSCVGLLQKGMTFVLFVVRMFFTADWFQSVLPPSVRMPSSVSCYAIP